MAKMIDFLVVGQGIAGTILSYLLTDRGYSVVVLNEDKPSTSSKVAAGLYNPITGRVMKKTWLADELFEELVPFYRNLEKITNKKFLYELPIYRPFVSIEEQNDWVGKSGSGDYDPFIREVTSTPQFSGSLHDPYGGLLLNMSGYIDLPEMLLGWKNWLMRSGKYVEERFDEEKLDFKPEGIQYGELRVNKIIFCQGNGAVNSHYFGWLPFSPVKGEVLEVTADAPGEAIYNRGVFMLPKGNGRFRVGATYNWRNPDTKPTEEAKQELLERLAHLYRKPVKVQNQVAGIRPATKDRRPFLGVHPDQDRLAIFNGLGTKGVSLGPYFGKQMANFLISGEEILPEVNISRYYSLYFR